MDTWLMDVGAVARLLGVKPDSVRQAHYRARRRLREGSPGPWDMPPPDVVLGGRPLWELHTIEVWQERRRGRRG